MKRMEISKAVVRAKVINVTGGRNPTILCLVKEFSYEEIYGRKTGKIIFDDFSHKVSFNVRDEDAYGIIRCHARSEVERLVKGDIIEFSIHRIDDYTYYFSSLIVETKHRCGNGLSALESLIDIYDNN